MTQVKSYFDTAVAPAARTYDDQALVRVMLPSIREEFRALLPGAKESLSDIQDQIRKITLGGLLCKARVIGNAIGLDSPDDCYHILGTTRDIYNDLHDFYEYRGYNNRAERTTDLCARQGVLYAAIQSFKVQDMVPGYLEAQLIVGRYLKDLVPPAPRPSPQGFGN